MPQLDRLTAWLTDLWARLPALATDPHSLVGIVGALLVVAGQRLYRLAVIAPGVAGGAILGLQLGEGQEPLVKAGIIAALCILAGFALHMAERLAIAAAGAFVAVGLAEALAPRFLAGPTPWYLLLGAGLLGLLLFPRLYQRLLVVLTPAIGALCIGWALGRSQDLLLLAGLTLGGTVFQLALSSRGGEAPKKAPAKPKKKAR